MNRAGEILSISPAYAIPGGEVVVACRGFSPDDDGGFACCFNGRPGKLVGASENRLLVIVPDELESTDVDVHLESGGDRSEAKRMIVGRKLAGDLHIVANPAVDPADDSVILTRSGSRGQKLPVTLFRLENDGLVSEMSADIMNPTAVAFDPDGQLFVTARGDGEVCRVSPNDEVTTYASDLGIATGLAFDQAGVMFVGDRSGTIYKISGFGSAESFAILEPSVSAYHMAFGPDGRLYISAPGLCSFDSVFAIGKDGLEEVFFRGLGRPQGLAFDRDGSLYVAACLSGRRGIVKISPDGKDAKVFAAGMNVVGLCFTRLGEMIIAAGESVYSLPVGIRGTMLD